MGLFLADQKYNVENAVKGDANVAVPDHGGGFQDGIALENFNPGLPNDGLRWIPKGLMLDLMDNTTEPFQTNVTDLVSGYTIQ